MSSLRPQQPVSVRGQWRDTVTLRDRSTGGPISLDHADCVAVSLIPAGQSCCPRWDYGRLIWAGAAHPTLSASSIDGSGIVAIRPDGRSFSYVFPADRVSGVRPGPYEISVVVVMNGQSDEVLRERVTFY